LDYLLHGKGLGWRLAELLMIFFLEALFVTVMTCRWIILIRGYRNLSAVISFFEQILQVSALGLVMLNLDEPLRMIAFAFGYAVGSLAGSVIEEKLAIGFAFFQIVSDPASNLAQRLRDAGVGVTAWKAVGREGERQVLIVMVRRRLGRELIRLVEETDPRSFVVRLDPEAFRGGFLKKGLNTK